MSPVINIQNYSSASVAPFTETFDTPGSSSWVSTVTGIITVQCWGGGADGTDAGGGGGEFASSNVAVILGVSYGYLVGDVEGNTLWDIEVSGVPQANPGVGQSGGTGGTGDILFNGGNGGDSLALVLGGGGGGSGGSSGQGAVGSDGGDGGFGGLCNDGTGVGGGNGGDGKLVTGDAGQAPGGGGGGGFTTPGAGASGRIRLIYPAI